MSDSPLILVGYWHDEYTGKDLPNPQSLVDPYWEQEDRERIVHYLRSGARLRECLGTSYCRFPDGPPRHEMGNADLTDGIWLWPEGLWVYVARYSVRLPAPFINHMRARGFEIGSVDLVEARNRGVDGSYWSRWSSLEARQPRQ